MKLFACLFFVSALNALDLTTTETETEVECQAKTIIGFAYEGLDVNRLWDNLTPEEKLTIKTELFREILLLSGFDPD